MGMGMGMGMCTMGEIYVIGVEVEEIASTRKALPSDSILEFPCLSSMAQRNSKPQRSTREPTNNNRPSRLAIQRSRLLRRSQHIAYRTKEEGRCSAQSSSHPPSSPCRPTTISVPSSHLLDRDTTSFSFKPSDTRLATAHMPNLKVPHTACLLWNDLGGRCKLHSSHLRRSCLQHACRM